MGYSGREITGGASSSLTSWMRAISSISPAASRAGTAASRGPSCARSHRRPGPTVQRIVQMAGRGIIAELVDKFGSFRRRTFGTARADSDADGNRAARSRLTTPPLPPAHGCRQRDGSRGAGGAPGPAKCTPRRQTCSVGESDSPAASRMAPALCRQSPTDDRGSPRSSECCRAGRACRDAANHRSRRPWGTFQQTAGIHHRDLVGHLGNDAEIVGDQDDRHAGLACSSRSRSRICACTVTSSAVVGSSAMSSSGSHASAIAIMTR